MELLQRHHSGIKRLRENKSHECITETESGISLYYLNCNNCTISVPNKVVKIFFENCHNCYVIIKHCVTPIEVLRCEMTHFIVKGGNFIQLDLSKTILIDLINVVLDFYVVYCKTWDIIVNIPVHNKHYELFNDYFGEQFRTDILFNLPEITFKTHRI